MRIAVIGSKDEFENIRQSQESLRLATHLEDVGLLKTGDIVFDFTILDNLSRITEYAGIPKVHVFLNTVMSTLDDLVSNSQSSQCYFAGFNGLPTFFNGNLELSFSVRHKKELHTCIDELNLKYVEVKDRVGMVAPRVVAMIINEAFYTVEEGTASKSDIDNAMKLGTNYPFGPFEWAELIGLNNLCKLLTNLFKTTDDSRYHICELLRKEQMALGQ